ncbi:MAG: LysM peptidoglycan-binding domain-containing protein [Lachnospiraceae bacterium]|nr:LysM peptidoglycan-binding domain-containing protein [Lachnospiraceae bacterium]
MRKTIKKLLGVMLAVALGVTMLPAQEVKAEVWNVVTDVDETDMTEAQLLEAYMGDWEDSVLTKEHATLVLSKPWGEVISQIDTDWTYVGTVIIEGVPLSSEDYEIMEFTGKEPEGKAKALQFVSDEYNFEVYKGYNRLVGAKCLVIDATSKDGGELTRFEHIVKFVNDGEGFKESKIIDVLLAAQESVTEVPTDTEPKEEPREESKDEPKDEAQTIPSGRELAEGESVYVVKKGDCLWSIAKTLLGNGARYKELFTRNGDIVEKANLIFPGQEIIIPMK